MVESMQQSSGGAVPPAEATDRGREDAVKERFRAETMADIRRSAGGGVVSAANDVNFLRGLSPGADGSIEWNTGPTSHPVRSPSNLQVALLPEIEATPHALAPPLEGTARTLADLEYSRKQMEAGFARRIEGPDTGMVELFTDRAWRAVGNAGYDLASSGVTIYGLTTDEAFLDQTVAGAKHLAGQVVDNPVGAAKAVAAKTREYWNENSFGQIAEDVGRLGIGSLAASGTTVLGTKAIGVVGEGAMVAGRQLAPVAADVLEAVLQKQGLALSILPDESTFLMGGGKVPASAIGSTREVADVAAASGINPRLVQRLDAWHAYQERGGQLDMSRWVQQTQGAPWGAGFKSGYGDWISSVESVHGNSMLSTRPTTLYRLFSDEGTFLKWGISQDINTRYSGSFMADKQIFSYTNGARADMLKLERGMVETQPGPLNLEPWAGIRKER